MTVAGVDLAMRHNSSALAIGDPGERMRIVHVREWQPTGAALVPSVVCRAIAHDCADHGVTIVAADGHYIETLREALDAVKIALVDAPAVPSEAWLPTQDAFLEDRIDVLRHDRLRLQLEAVKFTYESGGLVKVHQDIASDGSHGDLASAMVLAVWLMRESVDTGRMLGGRMVRGDDTDRLLARLLAR